MNFLANEVGFKPAQAEVECVMRGRPNDIRVRAGLWLWFLIKFGEVFLWDIYCFPSWNSPISWIFRIVCPLKLLQKMGILT